MSSSIVVQFLFVFVLVDICLACSLVHFMHSDQDQEWGIIDKYTSQQIDNILILDQSEFKSTNEFFKELLTKAQSTCYNKNSQLKNQIWETVELEQIELLSPITPETSIFTTTSTGAILKKPQLSITTPRTIIKKPSFISMLGVKINLGLIFCNSITSTNTTLNKYNIEEYICGLTLINIFYSKDMEILEGSTINSENLPGYTQIGPHIILLSPEDKLTNVLKSLKGKQNLGAGIDFNFDFDKISIDFIVDQIYNVLHQRYEIFPGDVIQIPVINDSLQSSLLFSIFDPFLQIILDGQSYHSAVLWYHKTFDFTSNFFGSGSKIRTSVRSLDGLYDIGTLIATVRLDNSQHWNQYLPNTPYEDNFYVYILVSCIIWIILIGLVVFFIKKFKGKKTKKE